MKSKELKVLYEDDYIIAIDKSAGILTIPDRFNPDLPNIVSLLKTTYEDIIPVHRLDKFTSGVNLFAKDAETHRLLSMSFESREIEKYYYAIVDGTPSPESGRIDIPLSESTVTRGKMLAHKRGKESLTDYKIVKSFRTFSLVYIRLHTGRMHQIRVHMKYLGNPLIVDPLYGHRNQFFLSEIKLKKFNNGKNVEEKAILTRQPLHAEKLIFTHPYQNVKVEIKSEMPKDMQAVLNQMEKWIR